MNQIIVKADIEGLSVNQNHKRTNELRKELIDLEVAFCGCLYCGPGYKHVAFIVECNKDNEKYLEQVWEVDKPKGFDIMHEQGGLYIEFRGNVYEPIF